MRNSFRKPSLSPGEADINTTKAQDPQTGSYIWEVKEEREPAQK